MAQKKSPMNTGIEYTDAEIVQKNLTPELRANPDQSADTEDMLRKQWERDSRQVRGVFRRHDGNTDPLKFPFKKYKWDKLTNYTLYHGQVHTIPLGVADHLNYGCWTPVYGQKAGQIIQAGSINHPDATQPEVVGKNYRFSFASMDFGNPENAPRHLEVPQNNATSPRVA